MAVSRVPKNMTGSRLFHQKPHSRMQVSWGFRKISTWLVTTTNGWAVYSTLVGLRASESAVYRDLHPEGYIAWEYPTNRLLQRLPLAKYSSFCIIMWGLVLSCFAAVTNYQGAIAIRFFLGVFESAVSPGFAFFTSQVSPLLTYQPSSNSW